MLGEILEIDSENDTITLNGENGPVVLTVPHPDHRAAVGRLSVRDARKIADQLDADCTAAEAHGKFDLELRALRELIRKVHGV